MNNNGIEDILISRDYNAKKKKPKGFFIIFFILIIILIAFVGGYWYLTRDVVSSKELFVQNISKVNVNKLLKNEIYTNLWDRMQNENSQINSSINFTTDIENEELKDIDITKFKLDISNSNDIINKKNYSEAVLNYSGNEVFKLNLIATENEVAIASDEILDKYVGIHLDKIKDIFGYDINIEKIKELENAENIDFSEEELDEYVKKYLELFLNNTPDDKFETQENIAIENATEDVEVTNYSVTLSQDEFETILVKILEEIKNDDQLITKLISKENNTNETQLENQEEVQVETPEDVTPEENLEPEIPVIQINPVGTISVNSGNTVSEEAGDEVTSNENTISENTSSEITNTADAENVENIPTDTVENAVNQNETVNETEEIESIETTNIEELIRQEKSLEDQLTTIILGKKVNLTAEEFKTLIDDLIKEVKQLSGNGIKINVYASSENVEKINIVLPNDNILDVDFFSDDNPEMNSNQTYIKITYLAENENSEKNGFALEIKKEQSSASTTIDAEYSFIENEKINKKVKLNLKTEGTVNSKELKNDIVVTISTNKSETQVAIDNKIQFKEVSDLPGLNSENCIYLDLLPEAERQSLLDTIKAQITTLYTNKKDNLNFIDTNTYSQETLENQNTHQASSVTREEAKNVLINKVSNMMQEAIDNNEEFTIQNLVDLKIDGYKVSAAVTAESALIVVDVYKFNIDTNFMLTDVE